MPRRSSVIYRSQRPAPRLRRVGSAALLAFLAAGCSAGAVRSASASHGPDAREWIELFDGKTLNGWTPKIAKHDVGDNYANTFRVVDGTIQARYDGYGGNYNAQFGHLYYDRPFSYYLVSAEYRFVGDLYPGAPSYTLRNSGIMIHSQSAKSMAKDQDFPISIEVQLLGGNGTGERPTANVCTPGTNIVIKGQLITEHCLNSRSKTYNGEQWVRVEVVVLGDSLIQHIVNGDTVFEYSKPQIGGGVVSNFDPAVKQDGKLLTAGYIALQSESHPIDFRKVEIRRLP